MMENGELEVDVGSESDRRDAARSVGEMVL